MVSFARVLSARRIEAVVDYIRAELMGNAEKSARDLRYHTEANGWPHHDRYRPAYAFVQGMLPSDSPWESLSTEQRVGKRVFLSACLTCHDGHIRGENPMIWEPHAVSFPRSVDSCLDCHVSRPAELLPPSRAGILTPTPALVADSPYPIHGDARLLTASGAAAEKGQGVFLAHCAFCHAADGSSRNWIGSFLLPRPRDLSGRLPLYAEGTARLRAVIRDGIPGTSMPGWRSVLTGSQIENLIAYLTRTPDSETGLSWQPGRPHETSPPQWIRTSRVNSGRIKNP